MMQNLTDMFPSPPFASAEAAAASSPIPFRVPTDADLEALVPVVVALAMQPRQLALAVVSHLSGKSVAELAALPDATVEAAYIYAEHAINAVVDARVAARMATMTPKAKRKHAASVTMGSKRMKNLHENGRLDQLKRRAAA